MNPKDDLAPATLSTYQPLDPDDPGPPRDPLKDFLHGVLNAPTSRQKPLPDYVLELHQKQEFYKRARFMKNGNEYRLDFVTAKILGTHGIKLDVLEAMKVLCGSFVSAAEASHVAEDSLFYTFSTEGSQHQGIDALIHSKKSKANLDILGGPIGHLRALKSLEALENTAFFTHQKRDWVHYLNFLEEVAAQPAWGYEFMALS